MGIWDPRRSIRKLVVLWRSHLLNGLLVPRSHEDLLILAVNAARVANNILRILTIHTINNIILGAQYNMKKKRQQNQLQQILEVSVASPPAIEPNKLIDPALMTGDIYNSYNKVKQQKEDESRVNLTEELKIKQEEINRYKEEVLELKTTISLLEDRLESFQSERSVSSQSLKELFELVLKWVKDPGMERGRNYLFLSLLLYFSKHKQDKQFLILGRLLNLALQMYQISNS